MGRGVALAGLAVALAAFLAHAAALGGGFVYDDHRFVVQNPAIASLAHPRRFFSDPATASAAQGIEPDVWRPLRTLGFALDHALFGLAPLGWHAASLALHVVNALLVWVLLLRILPGEGPAAAGPPAGARAGTLAAATAGAILFAVHPATVECVAWVSSRGDLLAWTLVLLALEATHRPGLLRTVLGAALVGLACLAKESAVVAFAILPARDAALPAHVRPRLRTTVARTLLFAAVTGAYLLARQSVMPSPSDLPWLAQTGFPEGGRPAAARGMLAGVAWYARVLLWPTGFPFDRNVHTDPVPLAWSDPAVVLGACVLASVLLAGVLAWRRGDRAAAFGWLAAPLLLLPVSNVLVPLKAFAAERFLYPVLPCLAAAVAAGGLSLSARLSPGRRKALVASAAAGLVALGVLSGARALAWEDDESLWAAVQREDPMNPRAYEGLGFLRLREGRLGLAERAFSTYREFQPFDGKVHAELAAVFLRLHRDLEGRSATAPPSEGDSERIEVPRFVLEQAIAESRAAVEAWSRLGPTRGRGDAALVRSTLEGWREAALLYGDLAEARRANERLVDEDRAAGLPPAYGQRRMRAILAVLALSPPPRPGPAGRDALRRRVRADLLADLRIDPSLDDAGAFGALIPALTALLAERPDDDAVRRDRVVALLARADTATGETGARERDLLEADLEVLVRENPSDRGLAKTLEAVRARRPR